jgi:hypothetical protein
VTDQEADKIIHEAMGLPLDKWYCPRCKLYIDGKEVTFWEEHDSRCGGFGSHVKPEMDYHTPEGFFACWNWAKGEEWWNLFLRDWLSNDWDLDVYPQEHIERIVNYGFILVNPDTFATTLAEFLQMQTKTKESGG